MVEGQRTMCFITPTQDCTPECVLYETRLVNLAKTASNVGLSVTEFEIRQRAIYNALSPTEKEEQTTSREVFLFDNNIMQLPCEDPQA